MIYSAVRAGKFHVEGHLLKSYMKHVKPIAQRKGSDVAIEYDGQFRLQRLPEAVAWDDFQHDLYEEYQSYCESKIKCVKKPIRAGRRGEMCPVFVLPSTKATVHDKIAFTVTYAPNVNDLAMVSQPVESRVKAIYSHINQQSLNLQNTGHVLPTPVEHKVLECMLTGYDCRSKTALILGFKYGFRINSSIDTDPRKGL